MESGPFRTAMLILLFPGPCLAALLSQSVSQGQGFYLSVAVLSVLPTRPRPALLSLPDVPCNPCYVELYVSF